MKKTSLFRSAAALCAALVLLAGCGGGGDDGGGGYVDPPPSVRFGASSRFAGICTVEGQKKFVRSYLDEVYLWYDEIQEVDASRYATPEDYFYALLVRPKDEYSEAFYTGPTPRVQQSTVSAPQSRLADLLGSHTSPAAVPVATMLASPGGRPTGYIQFEHQDTGAQDDLIAAFRQLQAASPAPQDLILDLRRNQGGFLYVALAAASMVTGPRSEGKVFEQLRYNDKRAPLTAQSIFRFSGKVQFAESQFPVGTPLPQLDLPRVFVLTTEDTCSASESIINGLRGIGVQVIRIGSNTCGKPYGFREKSNCNGTYTYYAIEFQGFNAQGFGGYQGTGFTPTCQVAEAGTRGTATDTLLAAAFTYIDSGACPAGTFTNVQSAANPLMSTNLSRTPVRGARLLRPEDTQP